MKIKVVGILLALFLLFCLIAIPTNADNIDSKSDIFHQNDILCESTENQISFIAEKKHFSLDESVSFSYMFYPENPDEYICDINYLRTGFEVVNYVIEKDENYTNIIHFELNCLPEFSECYFLATVYTSSSKTYDLHVYAIKNESGIFISPFSLGDAKTKYVAYAEDAGILIKETEFLFKNGVIYQKTNDNVNFDTVADVSLNNFNSVTTSTTSNDSLTGYLNIHGYLKWVDDDGIEEYPLRKVKVEIYAKTSIGNVRLATTTSNDNGRYIFTANGFGPLFEDDYLDVFIRVFPGNDNVMVKNSAGNSYYWEEDPPGSHISLGGSTDSSWTYIPMTITMFPDEGKAFQISQAAITARDYAKEMMSKEPEDVIIYYPYDNPSMKDDNICYYGFDFYRLFGRAIFITDLAADTGLPNSYASWDIIMHEYGHHIQYQLEIINSPGGNHSSSDNNADVRASKDEGVRLAWAESWPTVFALLAQNYYYDAYLSGINTVGDLSYTAYNGPNYDIETSGILKGEACERSIMAVLWDIFDSANDANDTISLGHTAFWSVTTESKAKTFSEFIDHFYERYPGYIDDIGLNLSYYGMATSVPTYYNSVAPTQSTPPTFTWTAQGGSIYYPNDSFELIIYDKRGNVILSTGELTTTSYTLTAEEWHDVLYSYGTTYKVAVSTIQSGNPIAGSGSSVGPETGPYISGFASFTKPTASPIVYTGTILNNSTGKLQEITESLQPGQYMDYRVTFASTSRRIVQTFGTEDTYIYVYDSTGALVSSNDDGGYSSNSFINYYFNKDQQYTIRVKFYSADEAGKFKLSITPATIMVESSYTSLTSYEAIYSIDNVTSVNMSVSLYPNNTTILTFTPPVTGDYTFTIASNLDTYIYVIDPRSTEAVIRNGDFNDDDGDGQNPLLTKRLTAGVPYYIIVSTYNPGTMTSPTQVTLLVSKEE